MNGNLCRCATYLHPRSHSPRCRHQHRESGGGSLRVEQAATKLMTWFGSMT